MQPANQAVEGIASIAVRCPVFSLYGDQRDPQENTNMAKELTHDQVRELFDYRDGNLYWAVARQGINGGDIAGTVRKDGYIKIMINNKNYQAHRLIFLYHHGYLPKMLDHIDGDPSNNSIDNIREATNQQNGMNRKKPKSYRGKPTSSIYKGVCWYKRDKKWSACIQINGIRKYLGSFISEIEAAEAYNRSAIELFGGYAHLNIISQPSPLNIMLSNRHIRI